MGRKPLLLFGSILLILGTFVATLVAGNSPQLGLDLRGGISVRLFPVEGTDPALLDTARSIISNRVNSLGVAEPEVNRQGDSIVVDLPGVKDRQEALDVVGSTGELQNREVLGDRPADEKIPATTTTKPGATTTTVAGATTTTVAGATTTTVSGATTTATVAPTTTAPTTTAAPVTTTTAAPSTTVGANATTVPGATTTTAQGATTTTVPSTTTTAQDFTGKTCKDLIEADPTTWVWDQVRTAGGKPERCYALGPNLLGGESVSDADASFDRGQWGVDVTYKAGQFQPIATGYVNKRVAIVLDNAVISAPVINQGITGDQVRISGDFKQSEAENLALSLRYGSLPVKFDKEQQTVEDVSPSLGKDQLRAGIAAGVIGLVLVAVYMLLFYRLLGLVVWLGLAMTGMVMYTLVTWFGQVYGVTLTLSGVTGIIVSVGVTVDSYVVYFERLKDEVRSGKTVRSSVESGWRKAIRTIIAADAVSLIGAAVLYALTVGSVKGFAFFLGLSTVIDLVIAWCFMHPLVLMMSRKQSLVGMKRIGIASGLDVAGRTSV